MNIEALRQTMEKVLKSTYLTEGTETAVKGFIVDGDLNKFSPEVNRELSFLYESLISPIYQHISGGDYIPNIFVKLEA